MNDICMSNNVCVCVCNNNNNININDINTINIIISRLRGVEQEDLYAPLFYKPSSLFSCMKTECAPTLTLYSSLMWLGYTASHFHREPDSLKTNAPNHVVFDIVCEWVKQKWASNPSDCPVKIRPVLTEGIRFDHHPSLNTHRHKMFLPNPQAYWGPGTRAKKAHANPREEDAASHVEDGAASHGGGAASHGDETVQQAKKMRT
eukprot:GHVR01009366.1.p2 GENE.GHVR01009366.1~~GHVR01009366.1.p2  ORF type:complete len:204 (+),score=68.66 GHVR01009366.1:1387-1998(+)